MHQGILGSLESDHIEDLQEKAMHCFQELIQPDQYVGEVFSLGYETALVLINDFYRQKVGGIPSLCFLLATRIDLEHPIDFTHEDASAILLRVIDAAALPNSAEADRLRVEMAQDVSGEDEHWETRQDPITNNLLNFAGIKCRVIGTFFINPTPGNRDIELHFGSDISNYYPNRGLKVYKPNGLALSRIVNYRKPQDAHSNFVTIGEVRYASTNRDFQDIGNVEIAISPNDLLTQKTALFGMTRTGKSNTTKVMLKSVFSLRFSRKEGERIGQLVFDPNGEYANENVQDVDSAGNFTAVKNVWRVHPRGNRDDVVTYGILPHKNDPDRCLILLNFYIDLQIGKEIINSALSDIDSKYVQNFVQVRFDKEIDENDYSAKTRHKRRVLVYHTLLNKAGLRPPRDLLHSPEGLFSKDLLNAMSSSAHSNAANYQVAANTLRNPGASWDALAQAFEHLQDFITTKDSGYSDFNNRYTSDPNNSGETWADPDLERLLTMFAYTNGPRLIGRVREQHSEKIKGDYAAEIYIHLKNGRLVIVDQSTGDSAINKAASERIMWHIFRNQQKTFGLGNPPPQILIYIEEAHTLLPPGSETDIQNVWARTAKEGAKYRIGMVYATQEVSSIQRNILKNTANWFIGHLNNTDETRELCKYYDFEDFEHSIRRAPDKGFMRIKTLSNMYVIPAQIRMFDIEVRNAV